MESQFGNTIRKLREAQKLYLRQVASMLDMDTALLSKIEKGQRQLKKEQIPALAGILKADNVELETLWLADQLMQLVKDEPTANEALKSVSNKIRKRDEYGTSN